MRIQWIFSAAVPNRLAVLACVWAKYCRRRCDLPAGRSWRRKTTFVQGVAHGWGSLDSVSSPTFIIVNDYHRGDEAHLFHMDAYRLDSTPEAEELDLEAMLAQGPLLIEWPERIERARAGRTFVDQV